MKLDDRGWTENSQWGQKLRTPRRVRSPKSAQETAPQPSAAVPPAVSLGSSPANQPALAAGQSD